MSDGLGAGDRTGAHELAWLAGGGHDPFLAAGGDECAAGVAFSGFSLTSLNEARSTHALEPSFRKT